MLKHEIMQLLQDMDDGSRLEALRLMEAKRLLTEGRLSVSSIGYEVGYESVNQFSREYTRKFGGPPSRDLPRVSGTG